MALRSLIGFLRLLPLDRSVALAGAIGRRIAPWVNAKRHRLALENLAVALPHLTQEEREAVCMDHWANVARLVVETVQIDRILKDPERIAFASHAVLSRYTGKLGSAIGVGLHMGNWELAIWPFTVDGTNPAAFYRSLRNPYIDAYLCAQRRRLYPGGMFGRGQGDGAGDMQAARIASDYVRRGGRLAMLCDQHHRRGIPVQLFGRETLAQPIAAIIARRLGARIWLARCLRVGDECRFRIEVMELRVPRSSNQADDIRATMAAMYRQFEAWIRENPEQWVWSNRKWTAGPLPSSGRHVVYLSPGHGDDILGTRRGLGPDGLPS